MASFTSDHIVRIERDRVRSLLEIDQHAFDSIHAENYRLCNPTGAVWTKRQYLEMLLTGTMRYTRLELLGDIDTVVGSDLAVLRYRCLIELHINGHDIPAHQVWHTDVYQHNNSKWQCVWSQATGILENQPA